ncbi:SCP-like protein [Dictyocaulus viviparus]|uniref:SCP-like protein n=1 Tax=Dictyocaulus viviparus TaxID=29172 RepID=A0A0D8XJ64_DICVI|nr:SCP-like protein [Dictyocaulus viviparus]
MASLLLVLLTLAADIHHAIITSATQETMNCHDTNTNMNDSLRKAFLDGHNERRQTLLYGNPFPGRKAEELPKAKNMPLMTYDCELEKLAHETAKKCDNIGLSHNNFEYVGSNNMTSEDALFSTTTVDEAIGIWWNTLLSEGILVNLTPQENNLNKIPFLQTYDCELEKLAYETAKKCDNIGISHNNFQYVGSNNMTSEDALFSTTTVDEAISIWWNTLLLEGILVNLTPQPNNFNKIPFLQIANANTNKLGCAFYECNWNYDDITFLSITCQYGEPHIKIGVPIYEKSEE